jgi:hypothetical protein
MKGVTILSKKLSQVFLPTVELDGKTFTSVATGELPMRTGQWVKLNGSQKGQFIVAKNGTVYVSYAGKGDGFDGRTQRFARSVWHQKRKTAGVVPAVLGAPRSMTLPPVKDAVRNLYRRVPA